MNNDLIDLNGCIDLSRRALCRALAASPLLPLANAARAADPWPSRPIKWVVPYLAGTGPDTGARILAEAAGRLLGQPIIIENKGGAAGNIGARQVARATPDGYTWIYSAAPMAANVLMYRSPGYDVMKDFRHVMRLTTSDVLLVVHPASGIETLQDLIARARANPGKLDYASGGVGTPSHLGVELFLNAAGISATHVPYKGASELVNAVLGSQVGFGMPIFAVAYPHVKAGKLRALGVAAGKRNASLPDVPTLAEQGLKGVELTSWGGLSLPAGTADPIAARIYEVFSRMLKDPRVIAAMTELGSQVTPSTPEGYLQVIRHEIELTGRMMKSASIAPL
ncbi:Tripartite-type tricarboxylate transporter, receptor component TctC [Variovorax sp. OK605]|uniref:Bug family tripartite tricarboxylate transporter substrate binding protein n=1 Tax=unclassified Variovorax TaxID=663243 RepID=UPI0008C8982A|nr:Tripartite-type tricarboxylate transporter, receptor component TctC [Variovorax sp. OK202]SFE21463.1 Tripartite-type tricarboxylate transporter, receptor component TctC [Variovorax sp. OK212]SFP88693.1 Tripartite-type tricarboxylate transporter, receptor component TctC [Variovorax sp. OK605]